MQLESTDAGGALASGAVEQGSETDLIDGFNELSNERFFCSLTDFKILSEFNLRVLGSLDECGSTGGWRNKWARITGGHPWKSVRQCDVLRIGEQKSHVTMLATSQCGWDRGSIGF